LNNENLKIKNTSSVRISKYIQVNNIRFLLTGAICHTGKELSAGHYTYFQFYFNNGSGLGLAIRYDDNMVTKIDNLEDLFNSPEFQMDVYILSGIII
jgi:ubiquitin C-terminal hydrolase